MKAKTSYNLVSITEQPQFATGMYAKVYKVVFTYSYINSMTGVLETNEVHARVCYIKGETIDGKGNSYKSIHIYSVFYAFEDKVAGKGKFYFEKNQYARRQFDKQFFPKIKKWLKKAGLFEFKCA